jgi:hypothetical protein
MGISDGKSATQHGSLADAEALQARQREGLCYPKLSNEIVRSLDAGADSTYPASALIAPEIALERHAVSGGALELSHIAAKEHDAVGVVDAAVLS